MCGIAGYYSSQKKTGCIDALSMLRLLAHRGPDDEGFVFVNTETNEHANVSSDESNIQIKKKLPHIEEYKNYSHSLAMGHRRYSIIDLSSEGHQPMCLHNYIITFNGEIYNYIEVRQELETKHNVQFFTRTDTEVILAAYNVWGNRCFEKLNGFFAIVLYDPQRNKILFARDRIGKSPLYYTIFEGDIFWASEIKSILKICPSVRAQINHDAIDNFLLFAVRDYENETFWSHVKTFPAASFCEIDLKDVHSLAYIKPVSYWQFPEKRLSTKDISLHEAATGLMQRLNQSIEIRLRSDIPVAFTLSGGMDSSTLAALYSCNYGKPADFLTVRYDNPEFDETRYAKMVAAQYPDQIKLEIIDGMENNLINDLDFYTNLIEEPYHSPVLYTDYNLQKILKKKGYGVMLNGAGGDELLAGYEFEYFPSYIRYMAKHSPLKMISELINVNSTVNIRRSVMALVRLLNINVPKPAIPYFTNYKMNSKVIFSNKFQERMINNFRSNKMNYWMRSGNKSFMGVPMEPRMPFLDYNVVEWSFTLPPEYLIHHGWHKYILRVGIESKLPKEVVWRPVKTGFPFDHRLWLTTYKELLIKKMITTNIDFIDIKRLVGAYDLMAQKYPLLLWRYISLVLWYKMFIKEPPF
jgi:asparagine synthase (glutamine-hydrolysing)